MIPALPLIWPGPSAPARQESGKGGGGGGGKWVWEGRGEGVLWPLVIGHHLWVEVGGVGDPLAITLNHY